MKKATKARLTFDLKICQSITIDLKTLRVECLLLENPKEKEYNYSLKMISSSREFTSEHSSNLKNPLFAKSISFVQKDPYPENYSVKEHDEGRRVATKHYFADGKKSKKVKSKKEAMFIVSRESSGGQLPSRGPNGEDSSRKGPIAEGDDHHDIIPVALKPDNKRRLVWEYNENDKDILVIEVIIL